MLQKVWNKNQHNYHMTRIWYICFEYTGTSPTEDTSRAKCLSGVMVVVCDDFADQCVSDKFNISFQNVPPVTVKDNIYFLFL